jgi:hypothetical protein
MLKYNNQVDSIINQAYRYMKFFHKYAVIILVIALPALSLAAEFRTGEQPTVQSDEKIADDMYLAGGSITNGGVVNGDLIAGGGNIITIGDVKADVLAGGGNVNILSNVADDVRAFGGTILIVGKVGGDVVAGGGQVNIGGPGVGGDALIGGGTVRIDAPIAGKLIIGGGDVYINAPIGGDVRIMAEKITLGSRAVISGNLIYKAKKEIIKEAGAVVQGKITFELLERKNFSPKTFAAVFSVFLVWKFFALLVGALLAGLVFRRYSKEITAIATQKPLLELGRGFLTVIVLPIASILLFFTLVGIYLGVFGLLCFAITMLFSLIMTPIVVGSIVYRYFSKNELEISWKTILLGVFLFMLLGFVPFVGHLAQALLTLLTLGAIVALKMRIIKDWR